MTKHDKIKQHLERYGSITGRVAWDKYQLYRLSSIINRLRNRGMSITTEMVQKKDHQFAKYSFVKS